MRPGLYSQRVKLPRLRRRATLEPTWDWCVTDVIRKCTGIHPHPLPVDHLAFKQLGVVDVMIFSAGRY